MHWRMRYRQRKTIAALYRLFSEDVEFNLVAHGLTVLDVDLNGMIVYTQRPTWDAMEWINENVPSMTDNAWFLYDQKSCELHDDDACSYLFVCCS
jgi:hypothetical protein